MSAGGLRLREFDGLQLHHDSTFGFQPSESQTTQPNMGDYRTLPGSYIGVLLGWQ